MRFSYRHTRSTRSAEEVLPHHQQQHHEQDEQQQHEQQQLHQQEPNTTHGRPIERLINRLPTTIPKVDTWWSLTKAARVVMLGVSLLHPSSIRLPASSN